MRKKKREEKVEIIEGLMGDIGKALQGHLDARSAKELMIGLLAVGGIVVALSTEPALLAGAMGVAPFLKGKDKKSAKKARDAFRHIRRRGYVHVEEKNGQVTVRMTKRGMLYAKRHTLKFLPDTVKKPSAWDRRWRLIMFDIAAEERSTRDAFRTLIKRVGAIQMQKSVWLYPFDCAEQIEIFQRFFGLADRELRFVITSSIGEDSAYRKHFKLS